MDFQDLQNLSESYNCIYEQQIGVPLKDSSDRAAKDQLKRMIPKGEKIYTPKSSLQNAAYEPEGDIVSESHFEVGDDVVCKKSGMTGEVVKVDKEEKGKYYTVKREDGKKVKYAPDELKLEGGNGGASKEAETKFHTKLDKLVHKTFGKRPEEMKEEFDNFDVILEYLVAEGYADTNQNALVIMANMSEEWKETILEYGGGGGAAPNAPNAVVGAVDKLGSMFQKVAPKKPVKKQTPDGFNPHQKFN